MSAADFIVDRMEEMSRETAKLDREIAHLAAYAERLESELRLVADELRMRGYPTVAATIMERLERAKNNPHEIFSAPTPTTQPCNDQCEPNGCAECPLDNEARAKIVGDCHQG